MDYQEELWAATEERAEVKKNAKKSKNKKKKEKLKQKRAKQQQDITELPGTTPQQTSFSDNAHSKQFKQSLPDEALRPDEKPSVKVEKESPGNFLLKKMSPSNSIDEDDVEDADALEHEPDNDSQSNQIDFVLYLQQTGSIIALAKLMDALEYGGEDYDEELDDYERKMIREQKQLLRQQQQQQHTMQ